MVARTASEAGGIPNIEKMGAALGSNITALWQELRQYFSLE